MNKFKYSILALITITGTLFTACSSDDDAPLPVNEEEVITTLTVTLVPVGGGATVTLQSRDLDGDGPDVPVITITGGNLASSSVYTGSVVLLNETETPAENITTEVEEEDDEHQFFYTTSGSLDLTTSGFNTDGNGNDLGTTFSVTTGAASTGSYTVTLRHEPTKPNTGLADAGGETDISATFQVTIQ